MVFKNPYGYLIKHFKLIHLVLTAIYVYLAIKVSSILSYYNHFIDGTASKLDAMKYVNSFYLIAIILSFIICAVVYVLMRYKKKPRMLYLILCILYLVVFVMIRLSYQGLNTIYISVLDTKTLRLYRDFLSILIWFQYGSVLIVLFRGLGFDIKRFNFDSDLADLHLEEKDIEEIEVTLNGTQAIERKFNRRLREFRYYVLENKAFIILFVGVILIVGVISVTYNVEFVNKVYNQGEMFGTDQYRFEVFNTYVTNRDYDNNTINQTDNSYVIVRMAIGSNRDASVFNTANLILRIGNDSYTVNNKYGSRFVDLGNAYRGSKIASQGVYLFIYSVPNINLKKKMILDYAGTKKVRLSPKDIDEVQKEESYKLNRKIDLASSVYGKGYFNIVSYEIKKEFSYSYEYEVMGKKNSANITISGNNNIMHLVIDSDMPSSLSNYSFLAEKGVLKYTIDDKENTSIVGDKTPNSYSEGFYLSVDKDIENAKSIWFEITTRGRKYKYILK